MQIKPGDFVKYKVFGMTYSVDTKHQTLTKPKPYHAIREVRIVAPAKDTEFRASDWIVCKPCDYPQTDLRSWSGQKIWGIKESEIIEVKHEN